jgi:hypothetical protein
VFKILACSSKVYAQIKGKSMAKSKDQPPKTNTSPPKVRAKLNQS